MEVKWITAETECLTRVSTHAYIHSVRRRKYTREEYNGNRSLCGTGGMSDDGETYTPFVQLKEEIDSDYPKCKRCLKALESKSKK